MAAPPHIGIFRIHQYIYVLFEFLGCHDTAPWPVVGIPRMAGTIFTIASLLKGNLNTLWAMLSIWALLREKMHTLSVAL
jgi:hypothetical protein